MRVSEVGLLEVKVLGVERVQTSTIVLVAM